MSIFQWVYTKQGDHIHLSVCIMQHFCHSGISHLDLYDQPWTTSSCCGSDALHNRNQSDMVQRARNVAIFFGKFPQRKEELQKLHDNTKFPKIMLQHYSETPVANVIIIVQTFMENFFLLKTHMEKNEDIHKLWLKCHMLI